MARTINIPNTPWQDIPRAEPKIFSLADGLNQSVESIEIADSECTSVINMDSSFYPTVKVREGRTLLSQHTGIINRIFKYKDVWYAGNGLGLYKLSGDSWSAVYEYPTTNHNRLWNYVIFNDKLYFVNGSIDLQQYDGSSLTAISTAPKNSGYIAVHDNRVFLARNTDDNLKCSALRDATDWTNVDEYIGTVEIVVESGDGQKPQGLVEFADHIMIFKRYTLHELFGEDSTNFQMTDPFNFGAISDLAIVKTKDSLFFLGPDGFYQYLGGNSPRKVSEKVRDYIKSINMDFAHRCVGGFDGDRFIYLTLVTDNNTLPNLTLKFDIITGGWWVEDYVATAFYLDGNEFYMALDDGAIYKVGGVDDNGEPIEWEIITKPYSDGDEVHKKIINRIYVVADIEAGSSCSVYYSPDAEGNIWTLAKSLTATGTLRNTRIPVVVARPSEWWRLKISGSGTAKINRIVREMSGRGI